MADTIAVAYSLVILVVVGGFGFVMLRTIAGEDTGGDWKEFLRFPTGMSLSCQGYCLVEQNHMTT